MPLKEKHVDKSKYDKMTSRDPNTHIILPKEKIQNYQKLNLYIPSHLHRKFPDLKQFHISYDSDPVVRKKTNLMSNTQIINHRGIANSIQFLKTRSTGMLNQTRNHNSIHESQQEGTIDLSR